MSVNLRDEDRRAMDLLLDRPAAAGAGTDFRMETAFTPHAAPVGQEALAGVERVLELLSLLPVEEPPVGLLERTLARCEQGFESIEPAHRPIGLDSSIPHA